MVVFLATRFAKVDVEIFCQYLSTLPEPLPEDTACGEDQTRERSVENWGSLLNYLRRAPDYQCNPSGDQVDGGTAQKQKAIGKGGR